MNNVLTKSYLKKKRSMRRFSHDAAIARLKEEKKDLKNEIGGLTLCIKQGGHAEDVEAWREEREILKDELARVKWNLRDMKRYPDTAKGVLKYLKKDCSANFQNAEAIPDPEVEGVWKVTTPNDPSVEYVIAYLAGYREPIGKERASNDFECCDRSPVADATVKGFGEFRVWLANHIGDTSKSKHIKRCKKVLKEIGYEGPDMFSLSDPAIFDMWEDFNDSGCILPEYWEDVARNGLRDWMINMYPGLCPRSEVRKIDDCLED